MQTLVESIKPYRQWRHSGNRQPSELANPARVQLVKTQSPSAKEAGAAAATAK